MCDFPSRNDLDSGNFCDFGGYVEFSSPYYNTTSDFDEVTISVLRLGGSYGKISVDIITKDLLAVSINTGSDNYIDYQYTIKTLELEDGEVQKDFTITIYQKFDDSIEAKHFAIIMHNPTGGANLGMNHKDPMTDYF